MYDTLRMLTRRDLLAGLAFTTRPASLVNFAVPPGACDCHTHIIGDPAKFPFSPNHVYTPEPASPDEMSALHRALHIQRVVIVTPSFYGTDNSATLYGMKARGADARGIAVIDDRTPAADLDTMDSAGIRGIRLNLATVGLSDPQIARRLFQSAADRVRRLKWHVQIYADLPVIAGIKDLVAASPVPVVFDHFGGARASFGLTQPGWTDLVGLVHSGKAYVKLSAAYRVSTQPPDYPDVAPFAKALVAANPDRILWGTDWPHTNSTSSRPATEVTPLLAIDDARLLNQFAAWVPDTALRRRILSDNPKRLYGF